jgi:hypothetical protein
MWRVLDLQTGKVLAAFATPFVAQFATAEKSLTLVTAVGACVYIWLKVWRLYRKKE